MVLSDSAEPEEKQKELVEEYSNILDVLLLGEAGEALGQAKDAAGYLAAFDIGLWRRGWEFYGGARAFQNWLGVLITAFALALGAPFWFYTLQRVVGLRDALKPDEKEKKEGNEGG